MTTDSRIVMHGNPVDGFTFYGPFDTHDLAMVYAQDNFRSEAWWICFLEKPIYPDEDGEEEPPTEEWPYSDRDKDEWKHEAEKAMKLKR